MDLKKSFFGSKKIFPRLQKKETKAEGEPEPHQARSKKSFPIWRKCAPVGKKERKTQKRDWVSQKERKKERKQHLPARERDAESAGQQERKNEHDTNTTPA